MIAADVSDDDDGDDDDDEGGRTALEQSSSTRSAVHATVSMCGRRCRTQRDARRRARSRDAGRRMACPIFESRTANHHVWIWRERRIAVFFGFGNNLHSVLVRLQPSKPT